MQRGKAKSSSPPPHPKRRKVEPSSNSMSQPGFLEKMRMRSSGGHFRMLNEKLYTCNGTEAFNLFKDDPQLFNVFKCVSSLVHSADVPTIYFEEPKE